MYDEWMRLKYKWVKSKSEVHSILVEKKIKEDQTKALEKWQMKRLKHFTSVNKHLLDQYADESPVL